MFTPRFICASWSAAESGLSAASAVPAMHSRASSATAKRFMSVPFISCRTARERRTRRVDFRRVRRDVRADLRLEVIAEVGLRLVAHFLGGGFAAMFRDARVVLDTMPTDVQLRVAGLAL